MKVALLLFQVMLAIIGLADASFLTWEKLVGVIPDCHVAFKCDIVLSSPWASVGPVPVSAMGMAFYASFLSIIIARFVGIEELKLANFSFSLKNISLTWGVTGLLVSLLLISIMAFVLKAWCLFCLISATTSILLALTTGILYRLPDTERSYAD